MLSLEYIAGFVDGEGCFSLGRRKKVKNPAETLCYTAYFILANTNYNVLRLIQYSLELCEVTTKMYKAKAKMGHKLVWQLRTRNQAELLSICLLLYPYLTVKQAEVSVMIKYLQLCKLIKDEGLYNVFLDKKNDLYLEMKRLKAL